jgi:hypothetical protein
MDLENFIPADATPNSKKMMKTMLENQIKYMEEHHSDFTKKDIKDLLKIPEDLQTLLNVEDEDIYYLQNKDIGEK